MLDDNADSVNPETSAETPDQAPARPRRRRAASRPAGPPSPAPSRSAASAAAHGEELASAPQQDAEPASVERIDTVTQPQRVVEPVKAAEAGEQPDTAASPEGGKPVADEQPAEEERTARRPARKRATRDAGAATPRRRGRSEQVAEAPAPMPDFAQSAVGEEDELGARLRAAAEAAAVGRGRRRKVTGVVASPFGADADADPDAVLQSLAASIAGTAAPAGEPPVTPGDTGDSASPEELPADSEPDAASVDGQSTEPVEASDSDSAAPASAVSSGEADDDVDTDAPDNDEDPDNSEDSDNDEDPDNSEDPDTADDPDNVEGADNGEDSGEDSDDSEGPRRRRRRRGGRRRRRSSSDDSDDDSDTNGSDQDDSGESDQDEDSQDSDDSDNGEASDSGRRRRRRRRRRGEDNGGSDDDPNEVVVRVREPRASRRSASDEVTGIEGSTRLEAKRQRRREGRAAGRRRTPILSEAEFLARRESVKRSMLIRQREEYTQLAVLEDDILVEHYVDRASATSLIGNIYLGRVQNVLPSMEAAFVDIGRGRNAVLYAGEVDWDGLGAQGDQRKIEQVYKSGQTVLVQVSKDPVGAKGARLTGHISLPGRYVVYSPGGQLSGISRKLADTERHRLKEILGNLIEDDASVIVRTAAEGASEDELVRDVTRLRAQWESIEKKVKQGSAPQLLYSEPDLTLRIVRDLFTEDFDELVVQGSGGTEDIGESIRNYVDHVAPHLADRLVRWDSAEGDVFGKYRIDEQIAKALERKVFLPSGGSLVIDRTEAMTVIDVNTGRFTGTAGNLEATVTSNNLEAAEEVVRQLRLRDIGGIIVIDFIDMVLPSNRELLVRRLVECLSRDRTRHQVAEVSSLGLVQMTRKKIGTGLAEAFTEECTHCGGRGYHRFEEPVESQAPADGGDRGGRRGRGRHGSSGGGSGQSSSQDGALPAAAEDANTSGSGPARQPRSRSRRGQVEEAPAEEQLKTQEDAEQEASTEVAGEQLPEEKPVRRRGRRVRKQVEGHEAPHEGQAPGEDRQEAAEVVADAEQAEVDPIEDAPLNEEPNQTAEERDATAELSDQSTGESGEIPAAQPTPAQDETPTEESGE